MKAKSLGPPRHQKRVPHGEYFMLRAQQKAMADAVAADFLDTHSDRTRFAQTLITRFASSARENSPSAIRCTHQLQSSNSEANHSALPSQHSCSGHTPRLPAQPFLFFFSECGVKAPFEVSLRLDLHTYVYPFKPHAGIGLKLKCL